MLRLARVPLTAALTAGLVGALSAACAALTLISPTEGQAVRENVRVELPASAVGENSFISIMVGQPPSQKFVAALSRESGKQVGSSLVFFWNSKSPYYDPTQPMKDQYFKDGRYAMTLQVHGGNGRMTDSATVNIVLRNKVARTDPSPAISLVNTLSFGQIRTYVMNADVQVFDQVGLPVLGGLGVMSEARIVQSVEDVRPTGEILLRYRIDDGAYIRTQGTRIALYEGDPLKPQLYRLVTKHGKVVKANMFSKQAKYAITDILPVLPGTPVKEGDSWPDTFSLKVEGLTPVIKLEGSSMLDSFEWQDGRECAKIVSQLTGSAPVALANGKIQSAGPITAKITTYFSYRSGNMLKRDIALEFPASILPGAGDFAEASASTASTTAPPSLASIYEPFLEEAETGESYTPRSPVSKSRPGTSTTGTGADTGAKRGTVRMHVTVRLEK